MKQSKILLSLFATVILILGACSKNEATEATKTGNQEQTENHDHTQHAANGDLQEETKSIETLPSFLKDKPEEMSTVYAAVAKNRKLLESMPCYCGCGESAGHKDNYDCFIFENKTDGSIVWDDHATRCKVCLEIAAESVVLYNNGKSAKEIRDIIDSKYKEGYLKPTPTPKPQG
ncbi:PCYCGC domain-containing protein [Bacillus massiliogorillae]|uniref:PCYCGC motif-containing (lipo)protein n=1 Tax=Bacillus massiliigorillae TaxID=1243664 RepID=UPI0005AB808A